MSVSIGLTNTILIPTIDRLCSDKNHTLKGFFKREVVSRTLAFSTVFFRSVDALSNLFKAIRKSVHLGWQQRSRSIRSNALATDRKKVIFNHLNAFKNSIVREPLIIFKLITHPYLVTRTETVVSKLLLEIDHQKIADEQLKHMDPSSRDKDWKLTDFFGHIYVLNLDDNPVNKDLNKDPDRYKKRLETITKQLELIGVTKFERFRATHGSTELKKSVWDQIDDNSFDKSGEELDKIHAAQAGNYISHKRIIQDAYTNYKKAKKEFKAAKIQHQQSSNEADLKKALQTLEQTSSKVKEFSRIVIFEDDNGFGLLNKLHLNEPAKVDLNGAGTFFRLAMKELPKTWDMFYFMADHGYHWNLIKHTDHINQLHYGVCLNAIAINHIMYKKLLKKLNEIENPKAKVRPTDHAIAALHRDSCVYVSNPPLVYQAAGESSISKGVGNEPWNGTWPRDF